MKYTEPKDDEELYEAERNEIINEANLIKILDCEQLINCEEVFEFKDRIFLILDYMEGGSLE